jgi:hypothetical protein
MRKFAVTTFAVLYGILVLSISTERFNEWIAQEATGIRHFVSGQHFLSLSSTEKPKTSLRFKRSETYERYRRIVERPFVVESPQEGVGVSTVSTRQTPLRCFDYQAHWNDSPLSSRAPPFQI